VSFAFAQGSSQQPLGSNLSLITTDYYDGIGSETCEELKTALHDLIDDHTAVTYSSLWTYFQTTDNHLNDSGTEVIVWDMYSDNPAGSENEFTFVTEQCGNYQEEGDCYNREHTFPKSWWGGSTSQPQYTDLYVVVPSDGWVNGLRGNKPYGEVIDGTETHTTNNGSKVGTSMVSVPGYSGTVFEPRDEYKGDFARGYFYMATRYEDVIAGWENNNSESSAVLDGSSYLVFEPWVIELLSDWHEVDPVDQKEIDRNEAIFGIQGNRNPFIDHPGYVDAIWGDCIVDSCILVYTTADDGPGSLRSAIACAAEDDVITFSADVEGSVIVVSTDSILIDKKVTIYADGDANIVISSVTPQVSSLQSIFVVADGAEVTMTGLTINGGYGPIGSGIRNEGILTIEDTTISKGGVGVSSTVFNGQLGSIILKGGVSL